MTQGNAALVASHVRRALRRPFAKQVGLLGNGSNPRACEKYLDGLERFNLLLITEPAMAAPGNSHQLIAHSRLIESFVQSNCIGIGHHRVRVSVNRDDGGSPGRTYVSGDTRRAISSRSGRLPNQEIAYVRESGPCNISATSVMPYQLMI